MLGGGTCEHLKLVPPSEGGDGSFLSSNAIRPSTDDGYRRAVLAFLLFAAILSLPLGSASEVSVAFCKYFDELYAEGLGYSTGQQALFGFLHYNPALVPGAFPAVHQALQGWKRLAPSLSRHPEPWIVACAVAVYLSYHYGLAMAVAHLVQFDCYLRPYELFHLRFMDVLPPLRDEAHQFYCIVICPQEVGKPSKTNVYDDAVRLDSQHRPQVNLLIRLYLSLFSRSPFAKLFDFFMKSTNMPCLKRFSFWAFYLLALLRTVLVTVALLRTGFLIIDHIQKFKNGVAGPLLAL